MFQLNELWKTGKNRLCYADGNGKCPRPAGPLRLKKESPGRSVQEVSYC
mgnify:FL=1|jgi:hypothetical protein